jgi:hypothetical protein
VNCLSASCSIVARLRVANMMRYLVLVKRNLWGLSYSQDRCSIKPLGWLCIKEYRQHSFLGTVTGLASP